MIRVMRLAAIAALISYGAAASAASEAGASATPDTSAAAKNKKDPNEVVCEKQEVLGTRLGTKRICMTRAEWAEQRRNDRDTVDHSQTSSCMRQGGC